MTQGQRIKDTSTGSAWPCIVTASPHAHPGLLPSPQVLQGIDFTRVQIDNILCESHCAHVLAPLGYRPFRLGTMENDLLWRRLPLPAGANGSAVETASWSDAQPGYSLYTRPGDLLSGAAGHDGAKGERASRARGAAYGAARSGGKSGDRRSAGRGKGGGDQSS